MTNIFVVRHGETEYNRKDRMQGRGIDLPLNDTGIRQSNAIENYLRQFDLDIVVCSSLKRSKHTAKIIAEKQNSEVLSFKELDEIDFGAFEGKFADEIQNDLDQIHHQWRQGNIDFPLPEGESPKEAFKRADEKAKEILSDYKGDNILFVLHGRLIRILISNWLNYGFKNMHKVKHSNGSLYYLRWNEKGFEPIYLNKTDHLEQKTEKKADSE